MIDKNTELKYFNNKILTTFKVLHIPATFSNEVKKHIDISSQMSDLIQYMKKFDMIKLYLETTDRIKEQSDKL